VARRSARSLPRLIVPAHATLVIEKRIADHEREGMWLPPAMSRQELALRILATPMWPATGGGTITNPPNARLGAVSRGSP
jgi:hypothetical protein